MSHEIFFHGNFKSVQFNVMMADLSYSNTLSLFTLNLSICDAHKKLMNWLRGRRELSSISLEVMAIKF